MKNSMSVFAAFIGGALVGGAIALLLAPESGKETRKKISDFLDNLGSEKDADQEKEVENSSTTI